MPVTNIVKKAKNKNTKAPAWHQQLKLQRKIIEDFALRFAVLLFAFWVLSLAPSHPQKNELLNQAQDYANASSAYYQKAVSEYKRLIAQGKGLDRLYLELGKIHYSHAEFQEAIEAFRKSLNSDARKFLAISYYRLSNFTDALEVFSKEEGADSEYLYYYGLTCEKLNLFDRALGIYKTIKEPEFRLKAQERIALIDKADNLIYLKDLNPQLHTILRAAPSSKVYPQASALILLCDEKVETTADGMQTAYLHYVIKILNERGKENFSETQIGYDSTDEKVELVYARVIKPDGSLVEVGSRHIRDVSKYLNFPLYSNARAYIISFPEISVGAAIEYKVKIRRTQLINKKDFVLTYPVQSSEPIISANFSVVVPKEKGLHIKFINEKYNTFGAHLNPVIKQDGSCLVYSWQFKNTPQIIAESSMPSTVELNPTILISTFSNWQGLYDWWQALAQDKIKPDTSIKDKVRELTRGERSDEARARAIYNFCAKEIRYVGVEYGDAGYEPHAAGDIFKNKYGDCKDQAILLVTMLKEAGFSAQPVLIATKDYYNLNEDFPAMLFNHCIAAVSLKDKLVFLDPTAETCPFGDLPAGDQARKVLLFNSEGFRIQETPLYPAEHNLLKEELRLKINNDEGLVAQKAIFTYGLYDQGQRYWLLYTQPELIQEGLKEAIQGTSIGAKLVKYDIENLNDLNRQVVLKYEFYGPEYFTLAGPLRIMPQLAGFDASLVAKDRRKYAIDFDVLEAKQTILEIEIPHNFIIKYMPQSFMEDSPWLKFMVEYSHRNNKIYFRQETTLKKNRVLEEEYPDFKKFLEGLAKKTKERIVLERIS